MTMGNPFKLLSWSQNTDYLFQFTTSGVFRYLWTSKGPDPEKGNRTRYTEILLHLEPEKDD